MNPSRQRLARECFDWLQTFVLAIAAVTLLTAFVRLSPVSGYSMYPTLSENDILLVSGLFYEPSPGDIVTFQAPHSRLLAGGTAVKRVIALEGQTVDFDFENWCVTVDGVPVREDYINRVIGQSMDRGDLVFPAVVPAGCVFLLGDNRNESTDSRFSDIGFVDRRFLIGRVLFSLPLGR